MRSDDSAIQLIAYCLTCNRKLGVVATEHQSVRFICPNDSEDNPTHFTTIVVGRSGLLWAKIQSAILYYELHLSPINWFGSWRGLLKEHTGLYLVIRFAIILSALFLAGSICQCTSWSQFLSFLLFLVSAGVIFDTLMVTTSAAFISRFFSSPLRSTLLTLFSFIQLITSFGVMYVLLGDQFNNTLNPIQALYFSFVTITTLGYGDFRPLSGAWHVQLLVILQLIIGLYFLFILLAIITNWANALPKGIPTKRLSDIRPPPKPEDGNQGGED